MPKYGGKESYFLKSTKSKLIHTVYCKNDAICKLKSFLNTESEKVMLFSLILL